LSGTDWRVLAAIVRETAAQSKFADETYYVRLAMWANITGEPKTVHGRVRDSLVRLAAHGVIGYEPARRNGQRSKFWLPRPESTTPEEPGS